MIWHLTIHLDVDFDGCSKGTKLYGSNVLPIITNKLSNANHNLSPLLQSLSESNHQHTHLYISGNLLNLTLELGQPDETGAPRLPDRPEKGFGQMVPEEFFNKFMKNEVFYFIKI